jgi:hypothetical protein
MELYEARIASLQRFVAMTVLFHQIAVRVQSFFSKISFGWWGYRIDRTHSIMRVATTASPASGAHVRKQMEVLGVLNRLNRAVHVISAAWFRYKQKKVKALLNGAPLPTEPAVSDDQLTEGTSFMPEPVGPSLSNDVLSDADSLDDLGTG